MINNNEVGMSADVSESIEIGDKEYAITSLAGAVTFGSFAPYLGIGYGNAVDEAGRLTCHILARH